MGHARENVPDVKTKKFWGDSAILVLVTVKLSTWDKEKIFGFDHLMYEEKYLSLSDSKSNFIFFIQIE